MRCRLAQPNERMHATRDTSLVIERNRAGGRVMRGVRRASVLVRVEMITCAVCGNSNGNVHFVAREVMYGCAGEFEYVECSGCGCLQIAKIPADLSEYYSEDYYSFNMLTEEGRFKQFFIRRRAHHLAGHRSPIGRLYGRLRPAPLMPAWLKDTGIGFGDEILDVGCGSGGDLMQMSYVGFFRLTGIDPFIERDIHYRNGVVILRRSLAETYGAYDFIMLHHSLEHMPEQDATLRQLYRLLRPGGQVLVRIPVAGSFAWRKYRTDWVQLDAPRHLHLHTERGLNLLAERAGFGVERVVYDSDSFQFWGSEQVRRGIPIMYKVTGTLGPRAGLFTDAELAAFEEEALKLNEASEGDQACFYLRKG
jgi:SAM-dependent methyltransferase